MQNNYLDIDNILNIKSFDDFIRYNENVAQEMSIYKNNYKLGYSNVDNMISDISEYTAYSNYVYKNLCKMVLNSKNVTEEEKNELKHQINYNKKALLAKDKDGNTIHLAPYYVGYTKLYDTKGFCDYLKPLLEKVIPNLDKEITNLTFGFSKTISSKMEKNQKTSNTITGYVKRHAGDTPKQRLRRKDFKEGKADIAASNVVSRYETGNLGIHYEGFSIEGNNYQEALEQANRRLSSQEGKPSLIALYDKILVLDALESKHNSRGFFNRLFNRSKFKAEATYITNLKNTIVNNEYYKELNQNSINETKEYLYNNVISPMIAKQIDDKTKEIVDPRNKEDFEKRIERKEKQAIANEVRIVPENISMSPRTMFVIDEEDEAMESEDFEAINNPDLENVNNINEIEELEANN